MGVEIPIDPAVADQIQEVITAVDGQAVVDDLLALAAIGGERLDPTSDHPNHFATNRLALTEADVEARRSFIAPRMRQAGMNVLDDHPMGLVGVRPGLYEDLDPVVVLSHTDTVPSGDIYDGSLGVVGALRAMQIMHDRQIYTERDVMVVSLTLEESAPFGAALLGSRALWHGLTGDELDLRKPGDRSVREALGEKGAELAAQPYFGPHGLMLPTAYAALELHVEQDRKLVDGEVDLGVVDSIASPVRYRAGIGETPLQSDNRTYAHERYFRLTVQGEQNHSGATPMGVHSRADGLVETSRLLAGLLDDQQGEPVLSVGDIAVDDAAMNKIPGRTVSALRLAAESEAAVEAAYVQLQTVLERRAKMHADSPDIFPAEPYILEEIPEFEAGSFFASEEMSRRQHAAFALIGSVNAAANHYADKNVVGTVASFTTSPEGIISLEVDIRGIELASRDSAVDEIRHLMRREMNVFGLERPLDFTLGDPLPGSGAPPVELDTRLVEETIATIEQFGIGSVRRMHSAAGHDTQNVARAGVPSVMIFAQSENGIAHNPDAYTSTDNIRRAVQAQAAMILRLANEVPDFA